MSAALLVSGIGLGTYGRLRAADADSKSMMAQAQLLDTSAFHILEVNDINTQDTLRKKEELSADVRTQFAASGFATEAGAIADVAGRALREIQLNTKLAEYEATQARVQAKALKSQSKSTKTAALISTASSILSASSK